MGKKKTKQCSTFGVSEYSKLPKKIAVEGTPLAVCWTCFDGTGGNIAVYLPTEKEGVYELKGLRGEQRPT